MSKNIDERSESKKKRCFEVTFIQAPPRTIENQKANLVNTKEIEKMKRIKFLLTLIFMLPLMPALMVKVTNTFGDSYSGAAGKAGVFAHWKGRQYRRKYVIPANPNTTMQQTVRASFRAAGEIWKTLTSVQKLAYSYLATGLVMSGMNLFIKRWQIASTKALPTPTAPVQGIKQIASDSNSETDAGLTASQNFSLGHSPVQVGSLTYTPLATDPKAVDAYIDLDLGDLRIPVDIDATHGVDNDGVPVAEGDQLVISYHSRGRTVTREILATVGSAGTKIPARADIANALRAMYYPIDIGTDAAPVIVELYDKSLDSYYTLTSLSILNVADQAMVRFDREQPIDAASHVDYTSYTPIEGAKLEVVKADTSFITWRKYSESLGQIPVAETVEDAPYDWSLTAPGFLAITRAAQDAPLAAGHELVEMTAIA